MIGGTVARRPLVAFYLSFQYKWCCIILNVSCNLIVYFMLGVVQKRRPHKITKIDPLFPCPKNVRTGSTFPCPYGHTINFEKIGVFYTKKCGRLHMKTLPPLCPQNVSTGQTPFPLTTDVLYGHLDSPLLEKYIIYLISWGAGFLHFYGKPTRWTKVVINMWRSYAKGKSNLWIKKASLSRSQTWVLQ